MGSGSAFPRMGEHVAHAFFKLVDGRKEYRSSNDERIFAGDEALQTWRKQQQGWREDLSAHRRQWLNEIDFDWGIWRQPWETHFAAAVSFLARYGHCWVPAGWSEDPDLAEWLAFQWLWLKNPTKKRRVQ